LFGLITLLVLDALFLLFRLLATLALLVVLFVLLIVLALLVVPLDVFVVFCVLLALERLWVSRLALNCTGFGPNVRASSIISRDIPLDIIKRLAVPASGAGTLM